MVRTLAQRKRGGIAGHVERARPISLDVPAIQGTAGVQLRPIADVSPHRDTNRVSAAAV